MTEVEFTIREAIPDDATEILQALKIIGSETPFLVMDEKGMGMTSAEMSENLANLYESVNNVLMLALADGKVIGTASVKASSKKRMEHIGEIGISILKDYWGFGLGSLMMEELIEWAKESKVIRRLELTVQHRNQRAVHVYEKIGFQTEAIMARGAKTDEGELLDVHLMSLMID
ncbi:GNAT family N-acetyltransferase [Enterococcus ureilyticus]|uniref:GNAT family N-acetyltransferase n=1 Tax=Enterococcus ureilyticus TaxID=1131292 RepID=A0A1E5HED9_9ENTE|nr:GNAT family N-acetyltransferase [Enterococcus ureilyticus]MBM7689556.1 RimJ/RimL family protein N-acetyltransferase [Enterococcus ureilyticus]MBO0446234.1 GNAT family N-acetyltransferase [Enterococcus ureilyticus]OEG23308.1 GNAT family N-acetyltransferase [Enterococcus ureilyticus]